MYADAEIYAALKESVKGQKLRKVLLLPPDLTRLHSYAGRITGMYYNLLKGTCQVDIMPALGTHDPMSREECLEMFGPEVPYEAIVAHNWRTDVIRVGEVPEDFVREVSDGVLDYSIDVLINKRLLDPSYDLIISIGQVVPHEVAGMANYTKNILIGCGGKDMIDKSHFLGAVYGMERIMGRDHSPVRKVFDYAEEHFLKSIPLTYVMTVTTLSGDTVNVEGLFIGRDRRLFEEAVALCRKKSLNLLDEPLKKVIVYLDEREFRSTWLGNKAIYRTRMAIADGGELVIIGPGIRKFGEDEGIDSLVRRYGYKGRAEILSLYRSNADLQANLSVAAHLIHGSSDGRFSITYAAGQLSKNEVEGVGYKYMEFYDALALYRPDRLKAGFNTLPNGEEVYYISNPAVGLWAAKSSFQGRGHE
ncbi:MAG TPA: lactate racemase domain-containing protein [Candidatus Atribacteria bacterium]|nr:lactate racemase domain-containing protein [Candidatus Atribacteria bacterium]